MKFLENITNRKLVAFITGNVVGLILVTLIIFFAPEQLVGLIPPFLGYFAGILAFFVAANAYEDGKKAQYLQPDTIFDEETRINKSPSNVEGK